MKQTYSETRVAIGVCLLLVGLVALVFGQGAWFDFTAFDDPNWVSDNADVQKGLSADSIRYAFSATIVGHWAPLTVLSHMATWQFFGANAGAHHLVNVGLHAAVAVLLFLALWSLTRGLWQSAVVAAFFAIHPLRAESVMWITERKDVLSGIFFCLTLWAYGWWTRRRGIARYLFVLVLTACGLMSKSMLVTLPCVLLLLDVWPLQRWNEKGDFARRLVEKVPFFALAAWMAFRQYGLVEKTLIPVHTIGWDGRIGNAVASYAVYIWQLFWPTPLSVFYPHPIAPPVWQLTVSILALLAITGVVWRFGSRHPFLWIGWLWFLGMLFPVIGLIQSGDLARADRYTYLPQVGLLIIVVWGVSKAIEGNRQRILLVASMSTVALAATVVAARIQASTWKDEERLWSHALSVDPANYRAWHSLGMVKAGKKDFPTAIAYFHEVIRLHPNDWHAPMNLGLTLLETGDIDGAFSVAQSTVDAYPTQTATNLGRAFKGAGQFPAAAWCFQKALAAQPDNNDAELELAFVLARLGAIAESEHAYASILKRQPGRLEALAELGMLLTQEGRIDEAIPLLEEALRKEPDNAKVLIALANARLRQSQPSLAVGLYRKALARQPDMAEAQANLAWQLATSVDDSLRNGKEAVQWAQRAVDGSHGTDPSILRILAAAQAEAGQYPEALATIQRAITLGQQQGDANLTARLEAQRDIYASNTPLRVPLMPAVR